MAIGGLYVGQSVISGITFSALPSVLRDRGLSLDYIGLTYLAVLPWVLKFLWAPALERFRLPQTGPSRSRPIVVTGGLISAFGLILAGWVGPTDFWPILAAFMVIAFAAATVDIACDGHAVESLRQEHQGWGNAAQVGGAYLGAAIGSGLFLLLVAQVDWTWATTAMALLLCLLGVPFLLVPASKSNAVRLHRPSIRQALGRAEMRKGLVLAAFYAASQKWGLAMLGPFLVDAGLDLASLGMLNGAGGVIVGFACALLGGACVRAWGSRPIMILALVLQTAALAGLGLAAWTGGTAPSLLVPLALASSSGIMALGFVALYAKFMELSDPRQAGIDFTLLQCTDALVSMIGGLGSGWIAQHFGYGACFGTAAAFTALALPIVALLCRRSPSLVTGTGKTLSPSAAVQQA
ncbi:MFS transporter [Microvirga sp. BT325]|uniref:MFS transporter n=1 Tax=Microvirga splendida TaxID=2795727 RepID=A0ABS0Y075_9HYPH|nr:MFS transporter [Microvirga splendida]MBJ6125713.1 MFS transporter [Microvirga splendida]